MKLLVSQEEWKMFVPKNVRFPNRILKSTRQWLLLTWLEEETLVSLHWARDFLWCKGFQKVARQNLCSNWAEHPVLKFGPEPPPPSPGHFQFWIGKRPPPHTPAQIIWWLIAVSPYHLVEMFVNQDKMCLHTRYFRTKQHTTLCEFLLT